MRRQSHVVHYFLDFSHTIGPDFGNDERTARLGYSYVYDWTDMAEDFFGLGVPRRPWFRQLGEPGYAIFRNFDVDTFVPDEWKMQYENPAFSRMTERDGAWMARIMARFTDEDLRRLAAMARFSDPRNTAHLEKVIEGRLARVLERYLTRVSPIGEVHVEDREKLCGTDMAALRGVRAAASFRFSAVESSVGSLPLEVRGQGVICAALRHVARDGGRPDDATDRYVRVAIDDGVARASLIAHLYDLGPARGFVLTGLERPAP